MHEMYRHWACKLILYLALFECFIILISQIFGKDSLSYINLQKMNLFMYIGDIDDKNTTFSPPMKTMTKKKYTWLLNSPLYSEFNITELGDKKRVSVLIIVSSGPVHYDRRMAIRETWWVECKQVKEVLPECIFMTDEQNPGDEYNQLLQVESNKYGDIVFQHLKGGVDFGQRMLYHMLYALTHYQFDYLLRMDDDNFFCLQNFLHQVPLPMIKQFHWGWVHCIPTITRAEEHMIMFSHDVIKAFLSQDPNKMLCHPWADQMIASWSKVIDMTYLFRHDHRIHHTPIVSQQPELREIPDVCKYFISIHGTYPDDMKLFWNHRGPQRPLEYPPKDLFMRSEVCPIKVPFEWRAFSAEWRYEPKFCINKPSWNTSREIILKGSYGGREATG